MSDLIERAFDEFAEATEATVLRLVEEIRALRTEVAEVREQARTAPEPVVAEGPQGPAGESGERGADGRGIESVEQRGGDLIFRFTDGAEVNLGRVTGEQGERGEPGERGEVGPAGERGERGEPGPRGEQGERGADGIASEEDLQARMEEMFREVQVRTLFDSHRGTYKRGESYRKADVVAWGGSTWGAMAETMAEPGTSPDWQLLAKKGRDGRDRT